VVNDNNNGGISMSKDTPSSGGEYTIEIVPVTPTYEREYRGCWPESLAKKAEPKEFKTFKQAFYIQPKEERNS
jgi:hypothetical protein